MKTATSKKPQNSHEAAVDSVGVVHALRKNGPMGTRLSGWMYVCVFGTSYVPKRGGTREPTANALAQTALFEVFRTTIEALQSKAFKVLGREGSKHWFEGRER